MDLSSPRAQKAKINILSSAVQQSVNFVCQMILPPLIISTYGSAYNGIVASITQCLSAVSLLRLGIAGAFRAALYKPLADGDVSSINSVVKAVDNYMHKSSIWVLIYIIVLAVAYPVFIVQSYNYFDIAILVISIGSVSFAEFLWGFTYDQLLTADQKVYIVNIFQIVSNLINVLLSVVLILGGCTIQFVKLICSGIFLLKPLFLKNFVLKNYTIDSYVIPAQDALKGRKDSMGHSVANIIYSNTDVVVLTLFTDVITVSIYSVYWLICTGIEHVLAVGMTGLEAAFGNMWAKGELENVRQKLHLFEYFISLFNSIFLSTVGILMLPFIALYTRGAKDAEYVLPLYAFLAVVSYGIRCFEMPYRIVIQAAGRYKETKCGRFWQAGINLILTIALVIPFGLYGVIIGTLVANLFGLIQYMKYVCTVMLKEDINSTLKRIMWTGINGYFVYLLCGSFVEQFGYLGWGMCLSCAIGTAAIGVAISIVMSFLFYRSDFYDSFRLVRRMLKARMA